MNENVLYGVGFVVAVLLATIFYYLYKICKHIKDEEK